MLLLLFTSGGSPAATNRLRSALAHLRPYSAIQPIPGSAAQEERQLSSWIYTGIPAAGGIITGNLTATEANDSLSSGASVEVNAALSATEGNDTLSSGASVAIAASLSITEGDDTLSSGATVSGGTVTATLSATEENDTLASTATNETPVPAPTKVGGDDAFRVEIYEPKKAKRKAKRLEKKLEALRDEIPEAVEHVSIPAPPVKATDWSSYIVQLNAIDGMLRELQAQLAEQDDEEVLMLLL